MGWLVREGGWARRPVVVAGRRRELRLWDGLAVERLGLAFSSTSLELLVACMEAQGELDPGLLRELARALGAPGAPLGDVVAVHRIGARAPRTPPAAARAAAVLARLAALVPGSTAVAVDAAGALIACAPGGRALADLLVRALARAERAGVPLPATTWSPLQDERPLLARALPRAGVRVAWTLPDLAPGDPGWAGRDPGWAAVEDHLDALDALLAEPGGASPVGVAPRATVGPASAVLPPRRAARGPGARPPAPRGEPAPDEAEPGAVTDAALARAPSPLTRLLAPEQLGASLGPDDPLAASAAGPLAGLAPLLTGDRAALLTWLDRAVARAWLAEEAARARLPAAAATQAYAQAARGLAAFVAGARAAGRPDALAPALCFARGWLAREGPRSAVVPAVRERARGLDRASERQAYAQAVADLLGAVAGVAGDLDAALATPVVDRDEPQRLLLALAADARPALDELEATRRELAGEVG